MRGLAPLDPPSADIARLYLQEADAVRARRDRRGGSRVQGWMTIATAAVIALFLTASILPQPTDRPIAAPTFVLVMVVVSQISSGATERDGVQRRVPRHRALLVAVIVICVFGVLSSFAVQVLFAPRPPFLLAAVPLWAACLVLGGLGVAQLRSARVVAGDHRPERPPFTRSARLTTLALGLLIATGVVAGAVDDPLVTSMVAIVAGVLVVIGCAGMGQDWGLAALGAVWRVPHYVDFGVGVAMLLGVAWNVSAGEPIDPRAGIASGVLVAIASVIVSMLPERAEHRGGR